MSLDFPLGETLSPILVGSPLSPRWGTRDSRAESGLSATERSRALAFILRGEGPGIAGIPASPALGASSAASGDTLAEFSSLSRERDPAIFYSGLLTLGGRIEERSSPEVVQRLYGLLARSPEVPASVANQARLRLQVLSGSASFLPQLEYGLSQVVRTSTSAEFLLGMTAGGIGFRVGRLWGMQGLLGAGLRGRSLTALAATAGVTTEAGVFLFTSKGIRTWRGESTSWSPEHLGAEYISTLGMLGGLRLSAWGMGNIYRGAQRNFPQSLLGRISEGSFQQMGMVGGLLAVHSAAMGIGLEEPRPLGALLAQVGGEWVSFNAGGRIARGLLGPHVASIERYLAARGHVLENPSRGGSSFLDIRGSWLAPEGLVPLATSGGSFRPPLPSPPRAPIGGEPVFAIGLGNRSRALSGESAAALGRAKTLPYFTPPDPPTPPTPPTPEAPFGTRDSGVRNKIWVGSQTELLEWIRGRRGNFHQRVMAEHIVFEMVSGERYDPDVVLQELNRLPFLREIFRGRRIQLRFDDGSPSTEFIRLGNRFFEYKGPSTPPNGHPVSNGSRAPDSGGISRELQDIRTRMERISSPRLPAVSIPTEPVSTNGKSRFILVQTPKGLLESIEWILSREPEVNHLEAVGYFSREFDPREINALRNRLFHLPVGRSFVFHEARNLTSYHFERTPEQTRTQMKVKPWPNPESRSELTARTVMEAIQGISRLRGFYPPDAQRLRVQITGEWNPAIHGRLFLEAINLEPGFLYREAQIKYVPPGSQSGLPMTQRFTRNETTGEWHLE